MTCWNLNIGKSDFQDEKIRSFIGGKPLLPLNTELPKCSLCGEQQAFIFQVDFPIKHFWSGLTLAVFNCVSCANEDYLIPEMLDGPLSGVNIPQDFLTRYQKNFRFIVFETSVGDLRRDYQEKVTYKPINLEAIEEEVVGNKIGGVPNWLLENEAASRYNQSYDMRFLLQLKQDMRFDIIDGAPHQMELGLMGDGDPEPSPNSYYQLFNGNNLYLFGVDNRDLPLVYVITQI